MPVDRVPTLGLDVDTVDDLDGAARRAGATCAAARRTPAGCWRASGAWAPMIDGPRGRTTRAAGGPGRRRPRGAARGARGADGFAAGEVLVVAHKVVSKAEGRVVALADVVASARAPSSWPPSWARTPRATSRSSCARAPRSSAPSTACSSAAPITASCAPTPASTRPTPPGADELVLLPVDPDASRARAAGRAARPPGGGHRRLLRPRLAPRPVRRRDRDRGPGAAGGLARAHRRPRPRAAARRGSRSPTRPRPPPTSRAAARTPASPPSSSRAWSATS